MRASAYVTRSLDGFIARQDGGLDWLESVKREPAQDYGYQKFMDTVDAIVMGRNTYEKVLTFGEWPYGSKPVAVLSSRPLSTPEPLTGTVRWMSGPPAEVVGELADQGAKHLYVDGGRTVQRFLDAGLVQRLIITTIPVLIGTGIPLFGHLGNLCLSSFPLDGEN